ncbi:MAG: non-ribosomal peptide synthetase [Simkania negevensis]|nr:non-ribosomal peptide synthetase [Simkania negevensis]
MPIDPSYPLSRIEAMVEDSGPLFVLTQEGLKDLFSSSLVVLINECFECHKLESNYSASPQDPAYIMYTSGSTGKPKGILVEHQALFHAALVYESKHPNKLISLMAGSISFDASLLVIVHSLALGGTVCIPKGGIALDFGEIGDFIRKYQINYTLCVPSFYSLILSKNLELPSLQVVDLGGDNVSTKLLQSHAKLAPNAILHNVYGPSEYSVGATIAKLYDPLTQKMEKVSIGKPLPQTQVYILDENREPVPLGEKGEIFIGGKGLARGYLNQDALSKEKFISFPIKGIGNVSVYRTGDFGCFLNDGNIEFLGRMDYQVKIRGYRIEIGEIEHMILQHSHVSEAVVVVTEELDGHKRLIAYFSSGSASVQAVDLQLFLKDSLPYYMLPSKIIRIKDWPFTPNGKIDRNALLHLSISESSLPLTLPSSEVEKTLFGVWHRLLGHDRFGVKDNFFDLGGDSLQIVEMQTVLESILGFKLSVADLFQNSTISMLADFISKNKQNERRVFAEMEFKDQKKVSFGKFKKTR